MITSQSDMQANIQPVRWLSMITLRQAVFVSWTWPTANLIRGQVDDRKRTFRNSRLYKEVSRLRHLIWPEVRSHENWTLFCSEPLESRQPTICGWNRQMPCFTLAYTYVMAGCHLLYVNLSYPLPRTLKGACWQSIGFHLHIFYSARISAHWHIWVCSKIHPPLMKRNPPFKVPPSLTYTRCVWSVKFVAGCHLLHNFWLRTLVMTLDEVVTIVNGSSKRRLRLKPAL